MSPGGGDATEQLLLKFGIDLNPVKNAVGAIKAALDELNKIADQTAKKSASNVTATTAEFARLRMAAQAATVINRKSLEQERLKTQQMQTQTAEAEKQARLAEARNAAARTETEEINKQIAALRLKGMQERANKPKEPQPGFGSQLASGLASRFGGPLGAALIAGGTAGITVAAVDKITEALGRLTARLHQSIASSGDLIDVWREFQSLAIGAGQDPEKVIQKYLKATTGLVQRIHLLKLHSMALRSGLKITDDALSELSGNLVELSERNAGDATAAINNLSTAMIRGRFVAVAMATGNTQLIEAMKDLDPEMDNAAKRTEQLNKMLVMTRVLLKDSGEGLNSLDDSLQRLGNVVADVLDLLSQGAQESGPVQGLLKQLDKFTMWLIENEEKVKRFGDALARAFLINVMGPFAALVPGWFDEAKPPEGRKTKIDEDNKAAQAAHIERLQMAADFAKKRNEIEANAIKARESAKEFALSEELRAEQDRYEQGEVELEAHLDRMEDITKQQNTSRLSVEAASYTAQSADIDARLDVAKEKLKTKEFALDRDKVKHEIAMLEQEKIAADKDYAAKTAEITAKTEAQRTDQTGVGIRERRKLRLDEIETEKHEALTFTERAQEINDRALSANAIDIDEYFTNATKLVNDRYDAEQRAIEATAAAHKESAKVRKDADKQLFDLAFAREKALTAITASEGQKRIDNINRTSGARSDRSRSALDRIRGAGPLAEGSEISAAENVLADLQREYKVRDDLLGLAVTTGEQTQQQLETMRKLRAEIRELERDLKNMKAVMPNVGAAFGSLGTGISSVFTSRFAQNLGSSVQAGASMITQAPALSERIRATLPEGAKSGDKMRHFADKLDASVTALSGFINAVTGAQSALAGGLAGGMAGAGLGSVAGNMVGTIFKSLKGVAGPIGEAVGAAVGIVAGVITGHKNAMVKKNVDKLNEEFDQLQDAFKENSNNLQQTIRGIEMLAARTQAMKNASGKGGEQYQKALDSYNDQLKQLKLQQQELIRDLNQQLALLRAPEGMRDFLGQLKDIVEQYNKFAGAAANVQDLAQANEWLTRSIKNYSDAVYEEFGNANMSAIEDALKLNDLLYQRSQLIDQINEQIRGVLTQGIAVRTPTRAQTAGEAINKIKEQTDRQMSRLNMEIELTQHRVNSEQQVFTMATTRIGLETQLLMLQKEQTDQDMTRLFALRDLVMAMGASSTNPWIQGLLATLQGVNTVPGGKKLTLDQLFAQAYESRSELGYGNYRGQNL